MTAKVYINGIGAVTAQGIWRPEIFSEAKALQQGISPADYPNYRDLIPGAALRRMSTGVKMGCYAAKQALLAADQETVEAIITGTGLGCSIDSDKFLQQIWANDEQYLTPTAFIQSTHNTVAAQLALLLGCKGYNMTYVNGASSFESACLDALLQLQAGELGQVLLGGVDEIATQTYEFLRLVGRIKPDVFPYAEGACFFSLATQRKASSCAELVDVELCNQLTTADLGLFVSNFLARQGLQTEDMDALMLGYTGNVQDDAYYAALEEILPHAQALQYKPLSGQYDTCSAFGLAAAAYILKQQEVHPVLYRDLQQRQSRPNRWKYLLLYHQYGGKDHALLLLRVC